MAQIEEIIKAVDNKLLEMGKDYLMLQQASKLLLALGIIENSKELKQLLENGEIPHAYKTDTSPKQWILPLSENGKHRKVQLDKKKSKKNSKPTKKKDKDQNCKSEVFHCTICGYAAMIPEQLRSDQYLVCPICKTSHINPLWTPNEPTNDQRGQKIYKKILFFSIAVLSIVLASLTDNSSDIGSSVQNSKLDASVYQVKHFLNDNLKDPSSYDPLEWSAVQTTPDGQYYVRHKYRARNGFGGMNIENKIFYLDKNGNVIGYKDF